MDAVNDDIANAPLPTPATVKARTNIFIQAWRFSAINVRMLKIIRKGHH